uniref:Protein SHQ1 homolog n=1 Tax=Macrostomum lignano TaxID=282301 RepID=A0A1I8F1K0_9PLAT
SSGLTASEFNVDAGGVLTLRIRKLVIGEQFPDLDMLNKLMAPAGASASSCSETVQSERRLLVEELLSGEEPPSECLAAAGADLDWCHLWWRIGIRVQATGRAICFYAARSRPSATGPGIHESHLERLAAKEALEDAQFDADYYLADQLNPSDMLTDILSRPGCLPSLLDSEERRARLMGLPRRPLLPPRLAGKCATILTQAACLSCQCPLTSVPQLLRSCYRRLLAYSLLRNWQLCQLVAMDTAGVLSNKLLTLDCLIRLERLLSSVEGYAGVNYLTVTDTCRWVQHCPSDLLNSLSEAIRNAANCFKKKRSDFGLIEWENEATSCGQDSAD